MEKENDDLLGSLGLIFPQNSYQLQNFKVMYADYPFQANEAAVNPERIIRKVEFENQEVSQIDYHKRAVLAAEIVYQLQEDSHMGHLKLEKVLYLCLNAGRISFYANFLKQAMGPYDPKLIRSLDKHFEQKKWFRYNRESFPKYIPLEKVGEHRVWFDRYFDKDRENINTLIETFRVFTGNQIELVATIFDSWKDIVEDKIPFSVELITKKVYSWSEYKVKFTVQQISNAVGWMQDKGMYPTQFQG